MVKELKKLISRDLYPGTVYPLLYELEQKGLVKGKWAQKGRRHIKLYSITSKGENLLSKLRNVLKEPIREALKELIEK